MFTKANGFFGLGVKKTAVGRDNVKMSALDQMFDNGIIEDRKFGIHTYLMNDTDVQSTIRFGGFNDELMQDGHGLVFLDTVSTDSWAVPMQQVDFHGKDILKKPSKAVFNPGNPFIAIPIDDFQKYSESLKAAHPDLNLVTTRYDWCYFIQSCDKVKDIIDPLVFTFGDENESKTFSIPASSFLVPDVDYRTNLTLCHLGIVG